MKISWKFSTAFGEWKRITDMNESSFLFQRYKMSLSWVRCPGTGFSRREGGAHSDKMVGREEGKVLKFYARCVLNEATFVTLSVKILSGQ